jgi:hypothetical protein
VGSIGENPSSRSPEVGISTSNGRAYYSITKLLKRAGLSYVDIIAGGYSSPIYVSGRSNSQISDHGNVKVIITTRRERLQFFEPNVLCIEDLGEDIGIARERIFPIIYPTRPTDWFIVGIDPGKRTGVAAFMNRREVESSVIQSMEGTIARVCALIDNAPSIRKIVKIGAGNALLARKIAQIIEARYHGGVRVQLVNESGTSSLTRKGARIPLTGFETRDQRAAKMIAFRDGRDYFPASS